MPTEPNSRDASGAPVLAIKRSHGLGDLVLLLPVLDKARDAGRRVRVTTRAEWVDVFAALRPGFHWDARETGDCTDLDALTAMVRPTEHRTDEFGRLVGIAPPFGAPAVEVPAEWAEPFERLRGAVVFAPDAEHPARRAPAEWAAHVARELAGGNLVLVGKHPGPAMPCDLDLRGRMGTRDLFAVAAAASVVVCMDSGVLHVAAAVGTPTVAVFGGVDPRYRVRRSQRVLALQADMDCCPCNKNETCDGLYPCLRAASAQDVVEVVDSVRTLRRLEVRRVRRQEQ